MGKLDEILERREELGDYKRRLSNMKLRIRVRDTPGRVKIGWFKEGDIGSLSVAEVDILYDFLSKEESKAQAEIEKINKQLKKLDKNL